MTADPRYPIGKFASKDSYTTAERGDFMQRIEALPARMIAAVKDFNDQQFDTPYRDGGWTVRQVIHHVSDSHMNAYIRVKWALTEDKPVIKPYEEKAWATTPETNAPASISLELLKALHAKWVLLLKGLSDAERDRLFIHPATQKTFNADQLMAMYAWHGDHHLAHITELKKRMGWK